MQTLLVQQPGLTAVIVVNELIFTGASKAIQERNVTVPDDISIIATISPRLVEKYTPKVPTVSVPAVAMGRLGAEFLLQQLEDPAVQAAAGSLACRVYPVTEYRPTEAARVAEVPILVLTWGWGKRV